MDTWDNDFLDLIEEAHITSGAAPDGEIVFGALTGFLDHRFGSRVGSACAEFSWAGNDETDPVCGRGWATIGTAGRLVGQFYIHNGDDSGFVANAGDFFNSLVVLGSREGEFGSDFATVAVRTVLSTG